MPCRPYAPVCSHALTVAFLAASLLSTICFTPDASAAEGIPDAKASVKTKALPAWVDVSRRPLWSFAWVSDMHMDGSRLDYIAKAFRHIDAEMKPHFVLFNGDNNAQPAPPKDPAKPEPLGERQQLFLKTFLHEHLRSPYVLITMDDWTEGFDKVFGPHQYSFDCGGLHFILLDPDRFYHGPGFEGLSVFDKRTWQWLEQDLERNRKLPTLVALHEPIYPATFLDAKPLRKLLNRYPNVVAVLQGHLHVDIERRCEGRTYLVCPSLGVPPARSMKLVHVYPEGLVLRTVAYRQSDDRFEMTDRVQCVEIPKPLRDGLAAPTGPKFVQAHYNTIPAHPILSDPSLAIRVGELISQAAETISNDARATDK
jgi:hypothetical protein